MNKDSKKVLLHICCGVCGFHSIRRLKELGYKVSGFFYNPNIYPYNEYQRRKDAAAKVCALEDVCFIETDYNSQDWQACCGMLGGEPEGALRCRLCYELRLKRTYQACKENSFSYFTTTLTISPHKKSQAIFDAACKISEDNFLKIDLKKGNGFKKTIELSNAHNLYRQNYCGCIFSLR
ncbi:MAG: epoxyqueuosine reductase QueH [Candidatus Omnitrophica bacterium]|nr:epoxyqueuosine reductase QueH [Candidatus Omnitrophota bacterium]